MHVQPTRLRVFGVVAGLAILAFSGLASADPPSRVARLGYLSGAVGFSPAGEDEWVQAGINRPLIPGDRLWVDEGARAEVQVGGAMIRMGAGTAVSVLNLDDRIAQLRLTQGTLNVRVRRLDPGQMFEVDTPNLAFTLRQPGEYRIEVDPEGDATTIFVRKGQGEVYGEGASYVIDSRQPYRFTGTGLYEYQYVQAPRFDEFDLWSSERDRRYDGSVSARYVSQDVIGYQDLDANGTWRVDATYGNVWFPNRVAADWAPYRDGHWAWVDPWGWTWVDEAPWGFAVSHYGRWAHLQGSWGWVPGPVRTRAYYAPALVAFVGGSGFQISISIGNVGAVGWFPLGPREVYRPSYPVSRSYFQNVNRSNTVISNTVINNHYDNSSVTNVYVNRQVPGAVVAVPATVFVQAQPVSRSAVRLPRETVASVPVAAVAPVAPTERSMRGSAAPSDKPPARVFERPVIARTVPAAPHVGLAAQERQLEAKPGRPLDDAARKELEPAAAAPAPAVKVITQTRAAPPTARPAPVARPAGQREEPEQTGKEERSGRVAASPPAAAPAAGEAKPQATPTPAPSQRQVAPTPGQSRSAAEPKAAAPQGAAPAAPAAKPSPQRARPESTPAATQTEPRAPVTAPGPPTKSKPAQEPTSEPRGQASKGATGRPSEATKDVDERKRDQEVRKRAQEERERAEEMRRQKP